MSDPARLTRKNLRAIDAALQALNDDTNALSLQSPQVARVPFVGEVGHFEKASGGVVGYGNGEWVFVPKGWGNK